MIKTCQLCGKKFDGYQSAKFCLDCRDEARRKRWREATRRYYQINCEQRREYNRYRHANIKLKLIREILSAEGVKRT